MLHKLKDSLSSGKNRQLSLSEVATYMAKDQLLAADLLDDIVQKGQHSQVHPFTFLHKLNLPNPKDLGRPLSADYLAQWMANWCGLEYVKIDPFEIDIESVATVVSDAYAKRLNILPIEVSTTKVVFAICEPFALNWVADLKRLLKRDVEVKMANPMDIATGLKEFYTVYKAIKKMNLQGQKGQLELLKKGQMQQLDRLVELGSLRRLNSGDSEVINIVDWLLQYARNERASDIHLEPKRGLCLIRFRVDGVLRVVYKLGPQVFLPVLSRLKIVADMKVDEKRRPQDGRIKHVIKGQANGEQLIDMRVSTIPTHYGEKMVIRFFDPKCAGQNLDQLGFYPADLEIYNQLISRQNGIVLVTGPTGSGKTTTLYSSLNQLASPHVNICTIEDPIEMLNDKFNQMQIHPAIGVDFAQAIKSFLRQDPDIIMVGEMRDRECAEMAVQASLTGHMVFSTLHTNCALSSITRLMDLKIPPFLINATLKAIVAQRLVRVLCPHCKRQVPTPKHLWDLLVQGHAIARPDHIYTQVGCHECKYTGFSGRQCIYELLPYSEKIKAMVHAQTEYWELLQKLQSDYTPMRLNGAKRVGEGLTTIEEVLKVVT